MILLLFFLSYDLASAKTKNNKIKVTVKFNDKPVSDAKVVLKQDQIVLDAVSSKNGEIVFNTEGMDEDKNMFLKVVKDGYEVKGYIGDIGDVTLNLKAKYGVVLGRVLYEGKAIEPHKIVLTSLDGTVKETYTDEKGLFLFNKVPILQHHTLEIFKDGYLPLKKEIVLNSAGSESYNEIYLDKQEYLINLKVVGYKDRYVFIEGIPSKLDMVGISSTVLKQFNKESIDIVIDGKKYKRKIDLNKKNHGFCIDVTQDQL